MTLDTVDVGGGITRVNLSGRLDIAGAAAIDLRFSALASGDRPLLLIDLSQVSYPRARRTQGVRSPRKKGRIQARPGPGAGAGAVASALTTLSYPSLR